MVTLTKKFKAATLLESIVAMLLLVICFSISVMVYVNVMDNDKQRMKLKGILLLNEIAEQVINEKNFLDDEFSVNDWTIKKTVTRFPETDNVYILNLLAKDRDGKIITQRNQLVTME